MQRLTLGLLALCATLANFVAWIALADHIDTAASAHDLAIWVTELQGTDGGYHFHDGCFSYRMVGKLNCLIALRVRKSRESSCLDRRTAAQASKFAPQESRILGFRPNFATPNSDPWTTLLGPLRFGHVKRTQSRTANCRANVARPPSRLGRCRVRENSCRNVSNR